MPALPPYIPPRDGPFGAWLDNFSALLTASPTTYGLTSGDAIVVAASTSVWDAAYALVTSPSTKTASTVQAKNVAKVDALNTVRPFAQQISLNAGVLASDKIAIGVNPRTSTPSPITPPTTQPMLILQSAAALSAIVRYRDSAASPSVKAKPYGVIGVQIFGKSSATPITDPTQLPLLVTASKSPIVLNLASQTVGQQLYLAARYILRTGQTSQFGNLINFTVLGAA
jgi:hypothetical protein